MVTASIIQEPILQEVCSPVERGHQLLAEHADRALLRLVVVGSVDDGKSTLIGRLLYDCGSLFDDQVSAAQRASRNGTLDFSLFTDGLLAEREQGITIDVAYRYFSTARRKVIVADTPGHVQYTRNMATGASTADAAVILVDARQGVLQQTRRHAYIAASLGIPYLAVAINKMDLVDYDRERFTELAAQVSELTTRLGFAEVRCFPVSAVHGDWVTAPSPAMAWHDQTLLAWLEALPHQSRQEHAPFRLSVQQILRPNIDDRFITGRVASGVLRVGDQVEVWPSRQVSRVARITTLTGDLEEAHAPLAVAVALSDDVDVGRGDVLAHPGQAPQVASDLMASLVWLGERPLAVGARYLLKQGTRTVPAQVVAVEGRIDLETLETAPATSLSANDIGRVHIVAARPLVFDPYRDNRSTGAFILIDPEDNLTAAAGMLRGEMTSAGAGRGLSQVSADARARRFGHFAAAVVVADSRAEAAAELERSLFDCGVVVSQAGQSIDHAVALVAAGVVAIVSVVEPDPAVRAAGAQRVSDALRAAGVVVCPARPVEQLAAELFALGSATLRGQP